jgi:peptidoglycan/LPS O-acetylase OafA/YrhL
MNYRRELDGLRAIAVLSVIIYHAELTFKGFSLLPGGFLGVDIFFVLSGFLITGILIDKSPTLLQFYKSRVDRIYPALLLMLFLSCIFAYIYLIPSDLLNFTEQLKGATAFYSNYIFMYEDSYVADSSQYKILLHTWSLGVEWQYYLAFPFIIYGIKKFFSSQFEQILIILFAVSFFYCLYLMKINNTFAFYSTPARVWELFTGGIVFLISKHLKDSKFDNILSAFGLIIIAYCLIFFKDTDAHPGFVSLLAVFGTTLFILFTKENTFIYKLSTLKISIFFGVISYSLYLYHQPILVFYRFAYGEIGNKVFIALFVLMILISYLSYRFFENPIRRSKSNKKYLILLFFILFIIAFYQVAKFTEGYKFRLPVDSSIMMKYFDGPEWTRLKSNTKGRLIDGKETDGCSERTPDTACQTKKNEEIDLVLIGDSYAGVFTSVLSENNNINSLFLHHGLCPLLDEPLWFGQNPYCWEVNKLRWEKLKTIKPTYILIGTAYTLFDGAKKSLSNYDKSVKGNSSEKVDSKIVWKSFRRSVEKLINMGYKPIIFLQPPRPDYDVAKFIKSEIQKNKLIFDVKYDAFPSLDVDRKVQEILSGLDVKYININKKLCKQNICLTINEKGGLFNIGRHLSYIGAKEFEKDIEKLIK